MNKPTRTHRYPLKYIFAWTFLIIFTILMFIAIMAGAEPTDKYDGDCTEQATEGRCADKPIDCSLEESAGRCIDKTKPLYDPESQAEPVSHNIETVQNPVDYGEKWGKQ